LAKAVCESSADTELVEAINAGNKEEFSQIIGRYKNRIFALIYRWCLNADDAEELTQETFVAAYFSLKRFRGESRFSTWMFGVAYNTFSKWRRKRLAAPKSNTADTAEWRSHWRTPSSVLRQKERHEAVSKALSQLNDGHRQVLTLRIHEELSYAEIAEVLNCPVGTVRSRLFNARMAARERLERAGITLAEA
jgi:RNA polymerase sigma-70 factor (ECF subfamily)